MNCDQAQQKMLLIESGELTGREAVRAEDHAAVCADCRAWRENTRMACALSKKILLQGEPSEMALNRIRQAAAAQAGQSQRRILFFPPPFRILASAAALALFVSGWFFMSGDKSYPRIENVNTIIAMVSDDATGYAEEAAPAETREQALQALANRLLILQGFAPADDSDAEWL